MGLLSHFYNYCDEQENILQKFCLVRSYSLEKFDYKIISLNEYIYNPNKRILIAIGNVYELLIKLMQRKIKQQLQQPAPANENSTSKTS